MRDLRLRLEPLSDPRREEHIVEWSYFMSAGLFTPARFEDPLRMLRCQETDDREKQRSEHQLWDHALRVIRRY